MKIKMVLAADFDGYYMDTRFECVMYSSQVVHRNFKSYGLDIAGASEIAKELVYYGGDIVKILQNALPKASVEEIHSVCDQYSIGAYENVYANAGFFPSAIGIMKEISKHSSIIHAISSLGSEKNIKKCLDRIGMTNSFSHIFGSPTENKQEHIDFLRNKYPEAFIVFGSDSVQDSKVKADFNIALLAPVDSIYDNMRRKEFEKNNAHIIRDVSEVLPLLENRGYLKKVA